MDFATSTLSGILGGVIATLICVVFREMWIKVIDPWWEEKVYKDAHIEGRWTSKYTLDGVARESVWAIHRIGHSIKATVTRTKGPDAGSTWTYVGTFRNLTLTATYSRADRRMLDRGAITLMLENNGEMLRGWLTFYSNRENQVRSVEYECTRFLEDAVLSGHRDTPNASVESFPETGPAHPKEPPVT
jgi:hypothetical protein